MCPNGMGISGQMGLSVSFYSHYCSKHTHTQSPGFCHSSLMGSVILTQREETKDNSGSKKEIRWVFIFEMSKLSFFLISKGQSCSEMLKKDTIATELI